MKNKYLIKIGAFVFFCTLFVTTIQGQGHCNLYEISLEEQVSQSSQIVEGKVISKQSHWDKNRQNIYTVNTIEVYKVFKGNAINTLEIITRGGVVDLQAQVFDPSLNLSVEDLGIFTLYPNTIEFSDENTSSLRKFQTYSSVQGFYKYNIPENRVVNPFYNIEGISQFYNRIIELTNQNYNSVLNFDVEELIQQSDVSNSTQGGFIIANFSPTTITAGTKSVLTINGGGFGATPGSVRFRDANNGGATFYIALDSQIISWSDTQILVEVPSRAGSGTFRVYTSFGANVQSLTSLQIPYSHINVITASNDSYPTQHFNQNGDGGMTWRPNIAFLSNTAANDSFARAFDTWVCETGINWEIGTLTTTNVTAFDGINIIRFDSNLPAGTLGTCASYFSGCNNGGQLEWFVSELDIFFNPTINWQFGPANANGAQIDFETVAVHELGHGHQLAHVIDPNKIMHYALSNGITNRILNQSDIDGANDVQNRSTTDPVCGNGLMTDSACSLSVDDFYLSDNISIYPNPTNATLFINNPTGINLSKGTIYDISGRLISTINSNINNNITPINVSEFATGIYFLKLDAENASTTFKFIVE
uniref:T9SS type A sorting domain-containing protein n=2 Tax=Gelidibacter sp. TaxID=2018083 RepID=UPI0040492400